jgi:hypothetical protein
VHPAPLKLEEQVMENIVTEIQGSKLIITVDISQETINKAPRSSTGKSKLVASSHGFASVNGNGLGMSLNVTYKS